MEATARQAFFAIPEADDLHLSANRVAGGKIEGTVNPGTDGRERRR